MNKAHWLLLPALLLACGQTPPAGNDAGGDAGSPADGGPDAGLDAGQDAGPQEAGLDAGADAGPDGGADAGADAGPMPVTFSYAPAWAGVTAVDVVGGFGQGSDWKQPFLSLTEDGGLWSGSAMLPEGQYLYLFKVTGDADQNSPTFARYAVDPGNSAYQVCPVGTPSVPTAASDPNPCSILSVPQGAPSPLFHVRGMATVDGGPAAGWLAVLERDESGSHHYFANRMDIDDGGGYDLACAAGRYRMQIQIPTFESLTDAQRDPLQLAVQRRGISAPFPVEADVEVSGLDLAHGGYAAMQPNDGGPFPLPVTFVYPLLPGAMSSHAAVYGALTKGDGGIQNIGDPWWTGKPTTTAAGTADFDGGFTTKQAQQPEAAPGQRYDWGDWQSYPRDDAGFQWQTESLVFPITFQ